MIMIWPLSSVKHWLHLVSRQLVSCIIYCMHMCMYIPLYMYLLNNMLSYNVYADMLLYYTCTCWLFLFEIKFQLGFAFIQCYFSILPITCVFSYHCYSS